MIKLNKIRLCKCHKQFVQLYEKQPFWYQENKKEEKGETSGMKIFRSMAPRFFTGYPNSKELRSKLVQTICTYQDLVDIIDKYKI